MNSKEAIVLLGGWLGQDESGHWKTLDYQGSDDSLRVKAAVQMYKAGPCLILASGGRAKLPDNAPYVAEVIKSELIAANVPDEVIILEICSYDTLDQLLETKKLIIREGLKGVSVLSNEWHLPRIQAMVDTHPLLKDLKLRYVSAESVLGIKSKLTMKHERQGERQVRDGTYSYGFNICGRKIGPGRPVFVVAEISGNHHQNYDEAVALIKAAKESGADAVKLQTYTADTMTLDSDKEWFRVGGEENPESWKGKILHQLYKENYTPWEWFPKLKNLTEDLGLVFFSTPFDTTAVDFLEELEVPVYKVSSYEATDIPLLKKVGETGKPAILSVGFASLSEIELAVETLRSSGAFKIALLHCLTSYSKEAKAELASLGTITDLSARFGVVSGFSDNNAGIEIPVAAVERGACIIEKHLILDRNMGGDDARFSLEPAEFKEMVKRIRLLTPRLAEDAESRRATLSSKRRGRKGEEGRIHYGPISPAEEYNKRFRRSIFASSDIKAGEKFSKDNIKVVRPAFGLEPKHYIEVLGKKAKTDIERATPLSWELIQ